MAKSGTSSLNARALALRTKAAQMKRKGRCDPGSSAPTATPLRRSPRSNKTKEAAQSSDAPMNIGKAPTRKSPRSSKAKEVASINTTLEPAEATQTKNTSRSVPAKATQSKTASRSKPAIATQSKTTSQGEPAKATQSKTTSRSGPAKTTQSKNTSSGAAKTIQSKKSVASKKLSFSGMSRNSSSRDRKGGKGKAGTMKVVDSDDEEEFENEDEKECDKNATGGLQLLRRGMVTMSRVTRRLIRGGKMKVKYNDDGEPVGKAAKEMQSYIGVLARTRVAIDIKDWRLVDLQLKDKIWESIQEAYVVPKQWKTMVLNSASQKWRKFKSKLTTWYIMPYLDNPEVFEFPPDDYRMIGINEWTEFVKDRISPKFLELRRKQKERRKEHRYPHRLGRKPYAELQEKLATTVPRDKLGRTTKWKAARQDKDGNYKVPEVKKKVDKIDKFEREESEGKRKFEGAVDALTLALGSPEYSGRVRGVGGSVKSDAYFNLPKRARLNSEESTRLTIKKILAEESENIVAAEKAKWKEEKAELEERVRRLEAKVEGKDKQTNETSPPKCARPRHDLGSGQGSCPRPLDKAVVKCNEEDGVNNSKKRLQLNEDRKKEAEEDEVIQKVQSTIGIPPAVEASVEVEVQDPKNQHHHDGSAANVKRCNLAIGSLDNIVAEGTLVEVNVEPGLQTVHGVPLAEDHVRVSVTKCIMEDVLLPVPIRDDILFVCDAVQTCVAWPKDWVIPSAAIDNAKQQKRKVGRKIKKRAEHMDDDYYDVCDLDNLPANLPPSLKTLSIWGNKFLVNGATIHPKLGEELFGYERKIAIFRRDLFAVTNLQEISGDTIVLYMSFLHELLKDKNMLDMIGFVDPCVTGALGCGSSTEQAQSLSAAFMKGKPCQTFLVPFNTGRHWTLTVVSPTEERVYYMDPLKRRMDITSEEWQTIVNQAIKIANAKKPKKGPKKAISWRNCSGIPEQLGTKSCGYFIMLYMREIVLDENQDWPNKWLNRGNESYTWDNVDVAREEWAKYVLNFTGN